MRSHSGSQYLGGKNIGTGRAQIDLAQAGGRCRAQDRAHIARILQILQQQYGLAPGRRRSRQALTNRQQLRGAAQGGHFGKNLFSQAPYRGSRWQLAQNGRDFRLALGMGIHK